MLTVGSFRFVYNPLCITIYNCQLIYLLVAHAMCELPDFAACVSWKSKASDCATNMQDDIFGHRSSRNTRSARYAPSGGVRLRLRPNAQKSGSSGDVSCSSSSLSPETFCSSLQAFVLLSSRVAFQRTFRSLPSPLVQLTLQASQPKQTNLTPTTRKLIR